MDKDFSTSTFPLIQKNLLLNMPQMSMGGLSENALFKELGNLHWQAISLSLGCPTDQILDEQGNRLYASFVRVHLESSTDFKSFHENESLKIQGVLSRYGKTMFFSNFFIEGAGKKGIHASLMSVFIARKVEDHPLNQQTPNKALFKSIPLGVQNCQCSIEASLPEFAKQYFGQKEKIHSFLEWEDPPLFQTSYKINPYSDLNGVNLLYFASYPQIHDYCERLYMHQFRDVYDIQGDWALSSSNLSRDVFYFGNCDVTDAILFHLNSCEFLEDFKIRFRSSLYRESDLSKIAQIETIKQLV